MLPFTVYFGADWKRAKVNLDFLLADRDLVDDGLDYGSLLFSREGRPAAIQVAGLGQDLVLAEELDLEEVDLALEPGLLVLNGLEALLEGAVGAAEPFRGDLVGHVQAVGLVHLLPGLAGLGLEAPQPLLLGLDLLVRLPEVLGHVLGREEEVPQLLVEDGFDVTNADLVPALPAEVLDAPGTGVDVHHAAAVTLGDAGEEVGRLGTGLPELFPLSVEDGHALGPGLLRDDGLDR